jgi:glycosyltransferase involved in cell wall biosynthesis
MLEALSTGCLIVGSNTAPVKEVIEDNVNGLLVDFFETGAIADKIEYALDNPTLMQPIKVNARQTILDRYDLNKLLPQHLDWILSSPHSEKRGF